MPRTTTRKKGRFRFITGRKGRNRVLMYHSPRSDVLTLEWVERDAGGIWKRRFRSLGHRDIERGKQEAETLAETLRHRGKIRKDGVLTLGSLIDIYEREETPKKSKSSQCHEKRAFKLFVRFWGREKNVATLSIREWNAYIAARRSGRISPDGSGNPVRDRIIEQDVTLLMTIFNWATMATESDGTYLLERNPFMGFERPREDNPDQPMFSIGQIGPVLDAAKKIDSRLSLALVLCDETGHRLSSVRQLQWSDIDLEARVVTWPARSDKVKKRHKDPLMDEAIAALKSERQRQVQQGRLLEDIRTGFVFPSARKQSQPLGRRIFYTLWHKLKEQHPELAIPPRLAFHGLRRQMASDMSSEPTVLVQAAGGWQNPDVVTKDYQKPTMDQIRAAMERRRHVA